ncbi:hypothetical protein QQP08_014816 [Theobroma cacao]|nr:hypothetical protein QQP08_014816 [Theobroma cacao]
MLKSDQVFKRSRHVLQSHWYGQKHPKRRQMPFVGRKREDMPKFISSNSEIQQPTILLKEKRCPHHHDSLHRINYSNNRESDNKKYTVQAYIFGAFLATLLCVHISLRRFNIVCTSNDQLLHTIMAL